MIRVVGERIYTVTRKRSRAGTGKWQALGQRIKALRRAHPNMSQRQLAQRAGVSHSMVSMWERGQICPSIHHLKKVAPVLGVRLDDLTLLAGYRDDNGQWALGDTATLPADPLAAVTQALAAGPWPPEVAHAITALLVVAQDEKRAVWEQRVSDAIKEVVESGYIAAAAEMDGHTTPSEIIQFAFGRLYQYIFQAEPNLKLMRRSQTESTHDATGVLP